MDYKKFVDNAVYSVQSQIGKQIMQLDSDLKSLNVFRVTDAREKINDMIEQSIGNYLDTLPKEQLNGLAKYVRAFVDLPFENLREQENLDFVSEEIKRMVLSFILDKADAAKPNKNQSEPGM